MPTRPARPAPPTRRRVRLIAVVLTAAAALALTACRDGEGLRDEGPSSSSTLNGSGPVTASDFGPVPVSGDRS